MMLPFLIFSGLLTGKSTAVNFSAGDSGVFRPAWLPDCPAGLWGNYQPVPDFERQTAGGPGRGGADGAVCAVPVPAYGKQKSVL